MVSGRALVWATETAVILAEIKIYSTGAMELHGLIAVGVAESIVNDLIPAAEQWARGNGFMFASIASRPGWAKLLEKDGYAVHQVYIRKELV